MNYLTLSLVAGAVAGMLNVIPMLFQRQAFSTCLSTFFVYLFASVLIFYGNLPHLPWWGDGMAVALMLTIPLLFTGTGKERQTVLPMLFNALFFGFLLAATKHFLS